MHAPLRRGPLRRLLAAIAQRCSWRLGAADLPPRAPGAVAHWEPEPSAAPLPDVPLPRAAPVAAAKATAGARATTAAQR